MTNLTQSLWSEGVTPALLASRNRNTGRVQFPPTKEASPLAADYELVSIGCSGMLYSYTVIHPNPKSGALPHALGYVDIEGVPLRLFGQLRGSNSPAIGKRYRVVADAQVGYVFEAIEEGDMA